MRYLYLLVLTVLALPVRAQQPGDLIITEVLANPGGAILDANGEWFEIYNATNQAINLQNWFVRDSSGAGLRPTHKIATSVVVPAFGFVVLGNTTNTMNNGGVTVQYAYGNALALSNSFDTIHLIAPDAVTLIDRVSYPGPSSAPDGISRELIDVTLDNQNVGGANWVDADASTVYGPGGRGTPGVAGQTDGVLPVELVSFTATLDGQSALLRWETASETNNSGFTVEHREDASAFRTVGFQPGRGTTAEASHYHFNTEALAVGTHTFRLKQTDFDGAFEYSPEVELTVAADGLVLTARADTGAITGSVAAPNGQPVQVELFDALGRLVAQANVAQGVFRLGGDLASGVYVVRVTSGSQALSQTAVVAR